MRMNENFTQKKSLWCVLCERYPSTEIMWLSFFSYRVHYFHGDWCHVLDHEREGNRVIITTFPGLSLSPRITSPPHSYHHATPTLSLISLFPLLHPTHLTLLPLPWDTVKALDIHLTTKGGGRGGDAGQGGRSRAGSVQTLLLAMIITSAQCNPPLLASPSKLLCTGGEFLFHTEFTPWSSGRLN